MRSYKDEEQKELQGVICNQCKRELNVENGILKEGCYEGTQKFGYFSHKDGEEHSFDLCEECYDKMIKNFAVQVYKKEVTELL